MLSLSEALSPPQRYREKARITSQLAAVRQLIVDAMRDDDETTATQLQAMLARYEVNVSLATIMRNRQDLGWVYRGSAYCQLIKKRE